jgi:hypothetical protein
MSDLCETFIYLLLILIYCPVGRGPMVDTTYNIELGWFMCCSSYVSMLCETK